MKAHVKVHAVPVPVATRPEIEVIYREERSCVVSERSWDDPAMMRGLVTMFGVRPDEVISSITINETGIKVRVSSRS